MGRLSDPGSPAQFMHEPWRHRAGFNPNASIISSMSPHSPLNCLRLRLTLATPESATGIVNRNRCESATYAAR